MCARIVMAVLVAMPVAVTANAVTPANPYAGQQTRSDRGLEVGFGPGVIIHRLSKLAAAGHVPGIDQSREMVEQARARNATGIQSGRVDLRHGSVKSLPLITTALIGRLRSTRCKSGRTRWLDCGKYGES